MRLKCPDLEQSRTKYRVGQDKDVHCFNCNKYRHLPRHCLLPNRTRKEPVLTECKIKKICKKIITENVKPGENHLLHDVHSLQHRVNNLRIKKRKTSFACFKVKHRNIFGLALIDIGNLFNSAKVSGDFWESIGP